MTGRGGLRGGVWAGNTANTQMWTPEPDLVRGNTSFLLSIQCQAQSPELLLGGKRQSGHMPGCLRTQAPSTASTPHPHRRPPRASSRLHTPHSPCWWGLSMSCRPHRRLEGKGGCVRDILRLCGSSLRSPCRGTLVLETEVQQGIKQESRPASPTQKRSASEAQAREKHYPSFLL